MKQIEELSKRITKASKKGISGQKISVTSRNKVITSKMPSSQIIKPNTPRSKRSNTIIDSNNSKRNSSFFGDVSTSIKQYFSSKKKHNNNNNILDNDII